MASASTAAAPAPWVTREAIGVAMIFIGEPLGWALRGLQGGSNPLYPIAAVILGFALLVRSHWLFAPKIHCDPVLLALPALLVWVPFLLLSLERPHDNLEGGLYAIFLAGTGLAIALSPQERFNTLPRAVMIIGLMASLDPFIELALGRSSSVSDLAQQATGRLASSGNANPLITGMVGSVTLLSALVVGDEEDGNSPLVGALAALAFTAGLGALIMSDKRSDEFMMFPIALVYGVLRFARVRTPARPGGGRQRLIFGSMLIGGIAALPALATLFFSKYALIMFETQSATRQSGFLNSLSGGSYAADGSTASRFATIEYTFKHLDFLGHGMMHESLLQGNGIYTHLVYLQAFYDLGVLGGLTFMGVMVFLPLTLGLLRAAKAPLKSVDLLIILLTIYVQGDNLSHGAPYSWEQMVPPLLCYTLLFGRGNVSEESDESVESEVRDDAIGASAG